MSKDCHKKEWRLYYIKIQIIYLVAISKMRRTSWWCWSSSSRILRPDKEQKLNINWANIRPQTPVLLRNNLPNKKSLDWYKERNTSTAFCFFGRITDDIWKVVQTKTLHSIFNYGAPVSPCDALEKVSQAAKETLRNIY